MTVALSAAVALSLGRIPAVDLPQHALLLRHFFEGDPAYEVRWSTPYLAFYMLARVAWLFTGDPVVGVRVAFAFSVALLPVASAALAASLRRPPVLGCFALLGAFSFATAWGFASFVLGAAMVGFCVAAAVSYARSPSRVGSIVLVSTLLLAYSSHPVAWVVALPSAWLVVLTRSPRRVIPLLLGTAVTVALCLFWQAGYERPEQIVVPFNAGPGAIERLGGLPTAAAALGRTGSLVAAWWALAAVFLACVAVGFAHLVRVIRRSRRLGRRTVMSVGLRPGLRRAALPICLAVTFASYLFAPLVVAGAFGIYPRFIMIVAVLIPAAVMIRRGSSGWLLLLPWLAPVAALWLTCTAGLEVAHNDGRTRCAGKLAAEVRPGEALLSLAWEPRPEGYRYPADMHLAAEPIARRAGALSFDFVDLGAAPVVYARGYRRQLVPSWAGDVRRFRPEHAGEFTAVWILGGPPLLARPESAPERFTCGDLTLFVDREVLPGSRPAVRFLPHRSVRSNKPPVDRSPRPQGRLP